MRLSMNGMVFEVEDGMTLLEVLAWAGHEDLRGIAVAIDDEVVPKSQWATTRPAEGQRIEVVRAVGGGSRRGPVPEPFSGLIPGPEGSGG